MRRRRLDVLTSRTRASRPIEWREREYSPFNNLPVPPTNIIGRDAVRAEIASVLQAPGTRLLTLEGPGGVGKTRLALAVASDLAGHFVDGVFFIPLENLTESALLPSAIAQALEIYTLPDETALETLAAQMSDMEALLLLDNFEQLLAAAPLLSHLLARCPRLKFLVTSRSALSIRGEHEVQVEPLTLPTPGKQTGLAAIEGNPAVQLFVERARALRPGFRLDEESAPVLAEICARLDGLPLAIELAAARIRLLSPKAMLSRLDKRLHLLTGGPLDLPPRQQTLRDALDWSYRLLSREERRLFRLLSAFSGGCTLEAAEAVDQQSHETDEETPNDATLRRSQRRNHGPSTLDAINSLAGKSLVRTTERDGDEPRLSMLETIREYAAELLQQHGESEEVRSRHAAYYLQLAEQAKPQLRGPDQLHWLNILAKEHANLRAALDWSTGANDGEPETNRLVRLELGLRIGRALARFWETRGHSQEGVGRLQTLLASTLSSRNEVREEALRATGRLLLNIGRHDEARVCYEEALSIAREIGSQEGATHALMGLANVAMEVGDEVSALCDYQECLRIWTALGHRAGIAGALNNIGLASTNRGDPAGAIHAFEQSIWLTRQLGDKERLAATLNNLGRAYLAMGKPDRAAEYVRDSFSMTLELGEEWNLAYDLLSFAEMARLQGDYRRVALLLGAAGAAYDGFEDRLDRYDLALRTTCMQAARQALGEPAFGAAWTEGLRLSPEEAVALPVAVASTIPRKPATVPGEALSSRELDVLRLVAQGLTDVQIAARLVLSKHTINAHLRSIYGKLDVSSRSAATRYAYQNGLL